MGKFKDENGKTRIGMFLAKHGKSIGKGVLKVADNTLLGGVVHNIISEVETPKGKISSKKLTRTIISSTIPVILLILLGLKVITIEQLKQLIVLF